MLEFWTVSKEVWQLQKRSRDGKNLCVLKLKNRVDMISEA